MNVFFTSLLYILTFLAMYVEVFFLVTFFERRKEIVTKLDDRPDRVYPNVTIIVPCWNEEKTVTGTVNSLLSLDYPKDYLHLILVDDGSTDSTWAVLKTFENIPNVHIVHKDNGGKHTAMNYGISVAKTDFIGCLDADSYVSADALKKMIPYFDDPKVMSVSPSIIVDNPKTPIEWAQKAEYQLSVYIKKMLGLMGGIHVTPGPFSIYRTKVFRDLGDYKYAHKTEDMEIAYRMQENGYRIEQCHDALVYTKPPKTAYALYKQRLRWIYGFLNNTIDYRRLIMRSEYGTFALFTIPAGIVSIFSAVYLFGFMIYSAFNFVFDKILKLQAVGSLWVGKPTFDWFFFDTHAFVFITIILYGFVITSLFLGSKMANGKLKLSLGMFYYIVIYSFLAPLWLMKALWKTITRREVAWR
jgi:cellulose synthase/poly-beta-1,6-N-acetylglucosamine synthase-like glycosyltransferase